MKIDVVVLAAGKGNRLKPITDTIPKSLIPINRRPVLERLLDEIPTENVGNVFIITSYLEDKIKNFIEKKSKKYTFKIKTITQNKKNKGTYGALKTAEKFLSDWFVVINGDDLHNKKSLKKFFCYKNQIGIFKKESKYFEVIFNGNNFFEGFKRDSNKNKRFIATGCYTLNKSFFILKPEKTIENEYGIPQTIEKNITVLKPEVVIEKGWHQLNTKEDLGDLKKHFKFKNYNIS